MSDTDPKQLRETIRSLTGFETVGAIKKSILDQSYKKIIVEYLTSTGYFGELNARIISDEFYIAHLPSSQLLILKNAENWVIAMEKSEKLNEFWHNIPLEKGLVNQMEGLLLFFLKNRGFLVEYREVDPSLPSIKSIRSKSLDLAFQKMYINHLMRIQRKTFLSNIGTIVWHTRRHPLGTETAIELHDTKVILAFLWRRETGAVRLLDVKGLAELPF